MRQYSTRAVWKNGVGRKLPDEPIDPSPTIDQAIDRGYPWHQIECSHRKTPREADMAAPAQPGRRVCMAWPAG